MIGKIELASIVNSLDDEMSEVYAKTGKAGLPAWLDRYEIEEEGMFYVASQRALKAVMHERGDAPVSVPTRVTLSEVEKTRHRLAMGTWVDGFAAGLKVARPISLDLPDGENRKAGR